MMNRANRTHAGAALEDEGAGAVGWQLVKRTIPRLRGKENHQRYLEARVLPRVMKRTILPARGEQPLLEIITVGKSLRNLEMPT